MTVKGTFAGSYHVDVLYRLSILLLHLEDLPDSYHSLVLAFFSNGKVRYSRERKVSRIGGISICFAVCPPPYLLLIFLSLATSSPSYRSSGTSKYKRRLKLLLSQR